MFEAGLVYQREVTQEKRTPEMSQT